MYINPATPTTEVIMNRFASTIAVTALLLSTLSISPATAAEPAPPAAVQAAVPITAPAAVIKFERVEVGTVAVPVIVKAKAAVKVPVKAPAKAAVKPDRKAVTQPLVVAPTFNAPERCEEDMPCWDCKTMGNTICGPVEPVFGTDAPFVFEGNPCPVVHPSEGGHGAWAGAGTACQIHKGK